METVQTPLRHIYHLADLDRVPEEACSATVTPRGPLGGEAPATGSSSANARSAAVAAVLTGQRAHVALVRQPRGTGSGIHTHPSEQFNYVLAGTLIADLDGQVIRVPKGHVVHVPAGMPYGHVAGPDEDAVFIAARDTRHGFAGPAADDVSGSNGRDNGREKGADGLPRPQTANTTGRKIRYDYRLADLDEVPQEPCSAKVTPRGYISKKSSSRGAALSGEALHVAIVHKAVGSGTKLHTHPNEQFSFVLEGTMIYEISGNKLEAAPGSITHLPPGVVHGAIASAAGDVLTFVVKDTSHGMSGPPIDGIEDGPVFLPGFGPQKKGS